LLEIRNRKDLNFNSTDPDMNEQISDILTSFKKARLIEDKISYENLAIMRNFSDDEVTFDLNR